MIVATLIAILVVIGLLVVMNGGFKFPNMSSKGRRGGWKAGGGCNCAMPPP